MHVIVYSDLDTPSNALVVCGISTLAVNFKFAVLAVFLTFALSHMHCLGGNDKTASPVVTV